MNIYNISLVNRLWEQLGDTRYRISVLVERPHLMSVSILDDDVEGTARRKVAEALLVHYHELETELVVKLHKLGVDISEPVTEDNEES